MSFCEDHVRRPRERPGFVWRKKKLMIRNLQNKKWPGSSCPGGLGEAAIRAGANFVLWYGDWVRFNLWPVTSDAYRLRGQPLRIETAGKNRRVGVCGAFRDPDGPFLFTYRR